MCGYQDALSNIMPVDWLDPYGRTPFAKGAEMSVDITIVETDDGIKASSVKNPPTAGPSRMMQAIKAALGVDMLDPCMPCDEPEKPENDKPEKEDDEDGNDRKQGSGRSEADNQPGMQPELRSDSQGR